MTNLSIVNDVRANELQTWVTQYFQSQTVKLLALPADASFRRYFRVFFADQTFIAMDAPPEKENCEPFIAIAQTFYELGLQVPQILAHDLNQGFLLLTDLGNDLYAQRLNNQTVDDLYERAFQALFIIQSCAAIKNYQLPNFDETLYRHEFNLFQEWYLQKYLSADLSLNEKNQLETSFNILYERALAQPQVCVHRDYHSRNLMVLAENQVGILDFQDAVKGPITYDLLSLLRDCYISWPDEQVRTWVLNFQKQSLQKGLLLNDNPQQFLRWFDEISLQRHLKCLGIFSRKYLRDQNTNYLQDIPRTLNYAKWVCSRYREFSDLLKILEKIR